MIFNDRIAAGLALGHRLKSLQDWQGAIVLGLPRGGVPVAFEVARLLCLPLDVLIVRKLGVPGQEELAMGAVATGGTRIVIESVVREFAISPESFQAVAAREEAEIEQREHLYRSGYSSPAIRNRVVILVDDGLATGASMLAAVRAVRPQAERTVVAVPVAAISTCRELSREADQVICLATPRPFIAVGRFYRNFDPVSDEEVRSLLAQANRTNSPDKT